MLTRRGIVLAVLALLVYAYFLPRWAAWNENSRLDLMISLVDDHTLTIDRYVGNTGDYAFYRGHYYSDKAPGMVFLGVFPYLALRTATPPALVARLAAQASTDAALAATLRAGGEGVTTDRLWFFLALVVTSFLTAAVPSALLVLLFHWLIGELGVSEPFRSVSTAIYAFGTIAFSYANSLIGHQTSAFFLFAAFCLLQAIRRGSCGRQWLPLAGFLLGYAAINEYQTVLIGGLLGLYVLIVIGRDPGTIARLAIGALPPLVALGTYDLAAFGTILPVGYFHSTLWASVHDQGFVSLTYPHLDALWGITFSSYRGLFFLSPVLLLALPGYLALWRRRQNRPEFWILLLAPTAFLLFNSSSAMWEGGFAIGPRYLIPSLPFLAAAMGVGMHWTWQQFRWLRLPVVAAALWSFAAVWAESIAGQGYPDYRPNPLMTFSLPRLLVGDIARNLGMAVGLHGWASLLPLVLILLAGVVALGRPRTDLPGP
ncbi:MAG: hypothetical protein IRY83_10805, partial [Chloroflexi bacterium]|nr:hypothetical protein [Chloroflexota bacterium]